MRCSLWFIPITYFSFLITSTRAKRPNVCINAADYHQVDGNKNCYYNEDYDLPVTDLIRKYTGIVESHEVITEDGYILTMFRIPRKNRKGVFLLQHAMFTNCLVYLLQGEDSIAFYLWRQGYEVWVNNQRGTIFSSKHVNSSIVQSEYWDFSFHEIGYHDVDAQVKYMRKITNNSQIFFYGYSLGTTDGLVYASLRPKAAAESIKLFIHVGLTCYYQYNTGIAPVLAKFVGLLRMLYKFLHIENNAIPLLPTVKAINRFITARFPMSLMIVYIFQLVATGPTPNEVDPRLLNSEAFRLGDYISIRTLLHLLQLMNAKNRFEMYDYGKEQNLKVYGSETPSLYPVENITAPTLIVYSEVDILTTKKDSLLLYQKLQPEAKKYGTLEVVGLNHEDYNFGIHRKEYLYDKILNIMDKVTSSTTVCLLTEK